MLKRPVVGDFRVQEEFGGVFSAAEPAPEVLAGAAAALEAAGQDTLYARVDGVVRDGRLEVMELELVEPSLFLGTAPGAVDRFAAVIAAGLD